MALRNAFDALNFAQLEDFARALPALFAHATVD